MWDTAFFFPFPFLFLSLSYSFLSLPLLCLSLFPFLAHVNSLTKVWNQRLEKNDKRKKKITPGKNVKGLGFFYKPPYWKKCTATPAVFHSLAKYKMIRWLFVKLCSPVFQHSSTDLLELYILCWYGHGRKFPLELGNPSLPQVTRIIWVIRVLHAVLLSLSQSSNRVIEAVHNEDTIFAYNSLWMAAVSYLQWPCGFCTLPAGYIVEWAADRLNSPCQLFI